MKKIITTLLLLCLSLHVFADRQTENEQLARINSVLNAVYPLIEAAQKAAPSGQRITFHYDWLTKDLQAIQAGIAQKINQTQVMPRVVQPLDTHYVQLTDKVRDHK